MTNFPHKVVSTYRVLMKKAFNEDIDETWIDWAIEMIREGYESDNLYILAGITKPYQQFELQRLTDKVFTDLNLVYEDKLLMIRNYIYYLISTSLNEPSNYLSTLKEIKDICIALDMEQKYMDFYLLYFAKDDLNDSEVQWYWDGADRTNIDLIIRNDFPTNGQYSDITVFENESDGVYVSFDPYGNCGIAQEGDNWIIKAEQITICEL